MAENATKQGYPSFEPPKLVATDVFELNVDPAIIDFSEETLKALVMPSKRPAAILQHLERQAEALRQMRAKIRDQLTRCQIEEQFMKKKLSAAPLNVDEESAPPAEQMDLDLPPPVIRHTPAKVHTKLKPIEPIKPISDDEEDDEDDEVEPLPDALRQSIFGRRDDYDDDGDDDDDEDDYASMEMRRILSSNR